MSNIFKQRGNQMKRKSVISRLIQNYSSNDKQLKFRKNQSQQLSISSKTKYMIIRNDKKSYQRYHMKKDSEGPTHLINNREKSEQISDRSNRNSKVFLNPIERKIQTQQITHLSIKTQRQNSFQSQKNTPFIYNNLEENQVQQMFYREVRIIQQFKILSKMTN